MPDAVCTRAGAPAARGDAGDDAYLFGLILAHAGSEARPLTRALGLDAATLARLLDRYAPEAAPPPGADAAGEDAPEEEDLRMLLLEHRAGADEAEEWLAAIVARRSLAPNHLWQDMGFTCRHELTLLFRRHFPGLVALNHGDMKWKKFFYRRLCAREGLSLCKAPNCAVCEDVALCFGAEDGEPLAVLARLAQA